MIHLPKKILIAYASYGSAHRVIAEYLGEYFKEHSEYEIKIIDLMEYENIIGSISKKANNQTLKNKISGIMFSLIYEFFNTKPTTIPYKPVIKSIFNNRLLQKEIVSFNPDLLISTHFFGNIIGSMLNKKNLINTKIISIIPDYKSHELWIKDEKSIDAIIVCNDIVKKQLISHKINSKKIYSYGIPISENFSKAENIQVLKQKYNVLNRKKTFLFFSGGGEGSTLSYKFLKELLEAKFDINIIYVCGKNEKIKKKVDALLTKNNYQNVTVLGYSNEVNNLLSISDVVITKPGGLSITECLEMKKPMLIIPGVGGQEYYNAKFVYKNGYGIYCKNSRKLVKTIDKILSKKNILISLKRNLDKYSDNKSVEKIYQLSKKLLNDN